MKNPTLILIPLIILAIICGVLLFSYWHQDDTVGPQIRGPPNWNESEQIM